MCDSSKLLVLPATEKSSALPPGRSSGHANRVSAFFTSGTMTVCGLPPFAEMRERLHPELIDGKFLRRSADGPKKITSSSLHDPPTGTGASHSVIGEPPRVDTFFS